MGEKITSIVEMLSTLPGHVHEMLESRLIDIEDALQLLSAKEGRCGLTLPLNAGGFAQLEIPAITSENLLSWILE